MNHPEPKETTVFFSEVGSCPDSDCDGQLKFNPLGNYDGAFANDNNVLVAIMICMKCGYTISHHFMLKPDDEPPQEVEEHPERDRAKAQALKAGVSLEEWENNKLGPCFDDDSDLPF
jgi:hypothetical protein